MNIDKFLSKEERITIMNSISKAESLSSAEIRVHIESKCKKSPLDRGVEIFYKLKMEKTELRNGVLVYIALSDRKAAIIADKGINDLVDDGFWDSTYKTMIDDFKTNSLCIGVCNAVENIGRVLKKFFPYKNNDINELSDEISFGD